MKLSCEEIVNHDQLLVNVFNHEHRILLWNKTCETFFGIPREKAVGSLLEDILPGTEDSEKMVRLQDALSGKDVFISDDRVGQTDRFYSQLVLPLRDQHGRVVAAVNIVRFLPGKADRSHLPESGRIHFSKVMTH